MKHPVTLIPGEGIGPEVATATRRILEAAGVQIEYRAGSGLAEGWKLEGGSPWRDSGTGIRAYNVRPSGGAFLHSVAQAFLPVMCG